MKRLLTILSTALLLLGCEGLFPQEQALISLDPDQAKSVDVSAEGGSFEVIFTSSLAWTSEIVYLSGSEGWASLNKTSGEGGNAIVKVKITVQKNETDQIRSAKFVIKSDTVSEEIVFTQSAAAKDPGNKPEQKVFNLSDGSAEVGAEGGRVQVTVQYNVKYDCTIPVDWIREVETKAYDEKVHVFEVDANPSTEPRTATISFCGNDTCIPFVVNQAAAEQEDPQDPEDPGTPVFELENASVEVSAEGGAVDAVVISNVEYDYTIPVDWVTEVTTRTATEYTHTFRVEENTAAEPRTATISFCGNDTCIPFTITQAGAESEQYLDVDKKSVSVPAEGTASPVSVKVTSNVSWTVTSDSDWASVSRASGENDGSFSITVAENTSDDSRFATISVVSSSGSLSETISVIQAPVSQEDGDDSWKTAEFHHRSLAFRFTADWCGYCPMMATAMSDAQKELPGKLEVISVHGGGSGLACSASNTLANNYPIDGFPTGLVDGRTYIANYAIPVTTSMIVEAVNETESKYETVTAASWTSKVSGSQMTMDLSAYIKKAGSYKITALLVEDKVISYQADYNNGASDAYEHNGIIRASLSDVLGESFDTAEDGQIKTFAYSATLPSSCNVNNVRVVVYIQRLDTSKNSYYVDNAATAKVGMTKALGLVSENWSGGNEGIVPGDDITL